MYDLTEFIKKHPGGSDWINFTQGTDITEAFEASHLVNTKYVEKLLATYFVKVAENSRNSPYTFNENGFYKTLKRKIEPKLKVISQHIISIQSEFNSVYTIEIIIIAIAKAFSIFVCIGSRHRKYK